MDAGIARVRAQLDAKAQWRPGCWFGAEMGNRGQYLVARCFQGVDAKVERRAACHRGRLRDPVLTKYLRQIWVEPLRVVARDMGGRAGKRPRGERGSFGLAQWRRRETPAVAQRSDGIDGHSALELQHAHHA